MQTCKDQSGESGPLRREESCGSSSNAAPPKMKAPLLIFPVDEDGVPYASRELLDTKISDKLHRYLLELDTFPGKDPRSIVISEIPSSVGNTGMVRTDGLNVITADGRMTFHSYSGGAGKGLKVFPDLEPVKLRQGWAIWLPKKEPLVPNELRVRIYGTCEEAESACILFGG